MTPAQRENGWGLGEGSMIHHPPPPTTPLGPAHIRVHVHPRLEPIFDCSMLCRRRRRWLWRSWWMAGGGIAPSPTHPQHHNHHNHQRPYSHTRTHSSAPKVASSAAFSSPTTHPPHHLYHRSVAVVVAAWAHRDGFSRGGPGLGVELPTPSLLHPVNYFVTFDFV